MTRFAVGHCVLALSLSLVACDRSHATPGATSPAAAPAVAAPKDVAAGEPAAPSAAAPSSVPAQAASALPPLIDQKGLAALLTSSKGRPVLVNVFASWCTPCKRELPDLAKLASEHPRYLVIGIDVDKEEEAVKQFLPSIPKAMKVYRQPAGFSSLLPGLHLPSDWNDAVPPGWADTVPLTLVFEASGEFGTGSVGQLSAEALAEIVRLDAPPAREPKRKK